MKKNSLFFGVAVMMCVCAFLPLPVQAQAAYDYVVTDPEYGINPNDKISDAKAIRELLKKAIGSDKMITYYFPAGTYYLDDTLKVYSNTHLILHEDAVMYRMDSMIDTNMLRNADQNGKQNATGGYNMSHDIIIEGGTWDGGNIKKATDGSVLVRVDHAENVTIKNCTVKNVYDNHLIAYVGVKNGLIDNCRLYGFRHKKGKEKSYNYAREAIQIDSAWTDNEKDMTDKSAYWAQGTVIDGTYCQDVTLSNNTVIDMPAGIGQHHYTKSGKYRNKNIVISNNTIRCSQDVKYCRVGISLGGMDNLTVTGNVVDGPYRYGMRIAGSDDVLLENNQVSNTEHNGLTMENGKGVTVKNNRFDNLGDSGIAVNGGTADAIVDNIIESAGKHGIFVGACTVNNIEGNKVKNTKQNGLCSASSIINSVKNNTFQNIKKHGISITGTKKNGNIKNVTGNIITKTKLNGISVNGGKVRHISSNTITDASGHGFSVIDGTVGKGKTNQYGIHKNTVKKCKKNGINVSKKGIVASIVGNKVSNIKKHGICLSENAKVYWVTKNTTKKCKGKGINNSLKKCKAKVKNNKGQK